MGIEDIIEVDYYVEGKWLTRRLPWTVAEREYRLLGQALGVHEHPQPAAIPADRLKVYVD
jgi:hypothetical protein